MFVFAKRESKEEHVAHKQQKIQIKADFFGIWEFMICCEDRACSTLRDSDTVIFFKEFSKMADIRIKILVFVKQEYLLSDIVRSGMCRSSAFVAMGKGCFSTFTICFDESVDSTSCDPSSIAALSLLPLVSTSFLITSYFFCSFIVSITFLIMSTSLSRDSILCLSC